MNSLPLIFTGIFLAFTTSWVGLVAYPYFNLGNLQPLASDEAVGGVVPPALSGQAIAGQRVYAANGCVYCHSQQVRQPHVTKADILRGWGKRASVARDYLRESPSFLGTQRIGPDLANIGARITDPQWLHRHLYEPSQVFPGTVMPSYRYLYNVRKIAGERSNQALDLTGPHAPKPGWEAVPTEDARNLVSYLISLNQNYPLPEAPEPAQE